MFNLAKNLDLFHSVYHALKFTAYQKTPQASFCGSCSKIVISSTELWAAAAISFSFLSSSPSLFLPIDKQREAALSRHDEAQTQTSKEEEEEGPKRATETSVGLCALLQRHPGGHQRPKPQRHLRGRLQDCGLHVGQLRRGTEAGTKYAHVEDLKWWDTQESQMRWNTVAGWKGKKSRPPY